MKYFLPAIIWGTIILVLCVMPGKSIPSFDWADLFSIDKLAHSIFYFVLVVLIDWGNKKNGISSNIFLITFVCILYGISLEFVQKYLCVDRCFEVLDMIANSVGALVAFAILYFKLKKQTIKSV
jgi:VanZ family protein